MKKLMAIFVFIISVLLTVQVAFKSFSPICSSFQSTAKIDCCQKKSNHCSKKESKKKLSEGCQKKDACASCCCFSVVYIFQNQQENLSTNLNKNISNEILTKFIYFTEGFISDWFHPPDII